MRCRSPDDFFYLVHHWGSGSEGRCVPGGIGCGMMDISFRSSNQRNYTITITAGGSVLRWLYLIFEFWAFLEILIPGSVLGIWILILQNNRGLVCLKKKKIVFIAMPGHYNKIHEI